MHECLAHAVYPSSVPTASYDCHQGSTPAIYSSRAIYNHTGASRIAAVFLTAKSMPSAFLEGQKGLQTA